MKVRVQVDALLSTDSTLGDEQVHSKQSDLNNLKTDPGRTGLDSLLKEIDKLQCIRDLGLPSNLFANISPKVLHHYRRMVPKILSVLEFRSNNNMHRPVISALELLKKYTGSPQHYYAPEDEVLIDGVLKSSWRDLIVEVDSDGQERVNRVNYEISVLQALRDKLRSKEIWVVGAKRYCNPEEDLPKDFEQSREVYYQALKQPLKASAFISCLQQEMGEALTQLEQNISNNAQVRILALFTKNIYATPLLRLPTPFFRFVSLNSGVKVQLLVLLTQRNLALGIRT